MKVLHALSAWVPYWGLDEPPRAEEVLVSLVEDDGLFVDLPGRRLPAKHNLKPEDMLRNLGVYFGTRLEAQQYADRAAPHWLERSNRELRCYYHRFVRQFGEFVGLSLLAQAMGVDMDRALSICRGELPAQECMAKQAQASLTQRGVL